MSRRSVVSVLVVVLALVGIGAIMAQLNRSNDIPLDPQNPQRYGAEAVASVLADQGVRVARVDAPSALQKASATNRTTVLISDPSSVSAPRLREIATKHRDVARLVLVMPDPQLLDDAFGLRVNGAPTAGPVPAGEDCTLRWGAGLTMPKRSALYRTDASAARCFTQDDGSAAFELPPTGERPRVLVLGSTDLLTNATIKQGDNAALALRSLGQSPELVWYSGGFDAASASAQGESVFPKWILPALFLAAACVVLLMVWRGRRLGRLVVEPLAVIVHANETTIARGQLYRKARDTVRAAEVLRAASRARLRTFLGLPPGTSDEHLAHQAALSSGRDPHQVTMLLRDDPRPIDEMTLTRLAKDLLALERQVRR